MRDFRSALIGARVLNNYSILQKDPAELCREVTYAFDRAPPPIEWHISLPEEEWNILTVL